MYAFFFVGADADVYGSSAKHDYTTIFSTCNNRVLINAASQEMVSPAISRRKFLSRKEG